MGNLAIDLALYYQKGTSRGDYSLLSSMDVKKAEFFAVFGRTINDLILRHDIDLERRRWRQAAGPTIPEDHFETEFKVKGRWVDGTPEYSFYMCGLRKLFPEALFIHIFRDVTSVVRSMLHFHQPGGASLVANEQEAYNYWLGAVNNCLLAERAFGPKVVFRLRYSDLTDKPEFALRSVFDFLEEPYAPQCLTPLARRINSSNVPDDFAIDIRHTDPRLIERAEHLSRDTQEGSQALEASAAAVEEIEAAFDERVEFAATLTSQYVTAVQKIVALKEKNRRTAARAKELAKQLEEKKARLHHKWLRSPLKALHQTLRPGNQKGERQASDGRAQSNAPSSKQ